MEKNSLEQTAFWRAGHYGRFPFRKKNREISVGAKVEFPIGKKLPFHFGRKPWYVVVPDDSIQWIWTSEYCYYSLLDTYQLIQGQGTRMVQKYFHCGASKKTNRACIDT